MAQCCCTGVWLRFDYLEQSHVISQGVETTEGSYWHAIVHRREPDFSNAKYWFRRVGQHAIFAPLRNAAERLAREHKTEPAADFLLRQSEWDPYQFVDLCEVALDGCPPVPATLLQTHSAVRMGIAIRPLLSAGHCTASAACT